jgi:hypothetical protein
METTTAEPMRCEKCNSATTVLINGWCCNCNPFRRCHKCGVGTMRNSPTPNWMNRLVCDRCKAKRSH